MRFILECRLLIGRAVPFPIPDAPTVLRRTSGSVGMLSHIRHSHLRLDIAVQPKVREILRRAKRKLARSAAVIDDSPIPKPKNYTSAFMRENQKLHKCPRREKRS